MLFWVSWLKDVQYNLLDIKTAVHGFTGITTPYTMALLSLCWVISNSQGNLRRQQEVKVYNGNVNMSRDILSLMPKIHIHTDTHTLSQMLSEARLTAVDGASLIKE